MDRPTGQPAHSRPKTRHEPRAHGCADPAGEGQFSQAARRTQQQRKWPHRGKSDLRARLPRSMGAHQRGNPPARPLAHADRHARLSHATLARVAQSLHAHEQIATALCDPGADGVCVRAHGLRPELVCANPPRYAANGHGSSSSPSVPASSWRTGPAARWGVQVLAAQLFSASAFSAPYGPWIFAVSVPLSARVFLLRHRRQSNRSPPRAPPGNDTSAGAPATPG